MGNIYHLLTHEMPSGNEPAHLLPVESAGRELDMQ